MLHRYPCNKIGPAKQEYLNPGDKTACPKLDGATVQNVRPIGLSNYNFKIFPSV
jgi:hypothetical protein